MPANRNALPLENSLEPEAPSVVDATTEESLPPADSVEQEIVPDVSVEEQSPLSEVAPGPVTGPSPERYAPRTSDGVDVVYFETSSVCACTAKVGDSIEDALLTNFQDELQTGELRYFLIISNDPANAELMDLFDSQPLQLHIVEMRNGQMTTEPVNDIWTIKNSPSTMVDFVHTLVMSCLEEVH